MAKARALVRRRKAVSNIRKITRTMQLIATARYQKAHRRAQGTRPYSEKIGELVERLSGLEGQIDQPLMRTNEGANRRVLLVITSNRGLCGGYNAAVLRAAVHQYQSTTESGEQVDLHVVGRKGIGYFRFLGYEMAGQYRQMSDAPSFAEVEELADAFIEAYCSQGVDSVQVAYMRFVSASQQRPTVTRLLPLRRAAGEGEAATGGPALDDYDFSPAPAELLAELLPLSVKVHLFQCFNDAVVSEQIARMVAMKAATDSANDMIKTLTQQYNRARQTQITTELLDVMGGAEALAQAEA